MSYKFLLGLFQAERMNPANPMNQPGKAMGKHINARIRKAKAKRAKGRVVKGKRHRAGRATYTL